MLEPPVSIGAQVVLNSGQLVQFEDKIDFEVDADDPVLVARFAAEDLRQAVGVVDTEPHLVALEPVDATRNEQGGQQRVGSHVRWVQWR